MGRSLMKSLIELWFPMRDGRDTAKLRLFVFPYAGGRASAFRGWSAGLPDTVEVLPLQPPGRERRMSEKPIGSMDEAVPVVLQALDSFLDRPFAFYGHSLGGLLAYEVVRSLRDRGGPLPVHFFASGSRAPHMPLKGSAIHTLEGEAFLNRLRVLGGTPPAVLECAELMELFTPMLLADFRMSETYLNAGIDPLPMPLTALGGIEDGEVGRERLEAWSTQTTAGFDLHWFPGGHFFLHEQEADVLSVVKSALAAHAS